MAAPKNLRDEEGFQAFLLYIGEAGLEPKLREICLSHTVTLREVFLDVRGATVQAARIEIWWWLQMHLRKSTPEIGRLFKRDHSSIVHAISKAKEQADAMGMEHTLENLHQIAIGVAEAQRQTWNRLSVMMVEKMAEKRAAKKDGG